MKGRIGFFKIVLLAVVMIISFNVKGHAYLGDFAISAKAGTLGAGVDLTIGLFPTLNARVGINAFNYHDSGTESEISYNYDVNLLSFPLFLDWHPFVYDNFRFSAGILFNQNEIKMNGKSQDSYNIGGTRYQGAQLGKMTGEMTFDEIAPYVGIGWGNAVRGQRNWSFNCDLGVMFQGNPDINMKSDGPISSDPVFQANLESETRELEDTIDGYRYYPVIFIGISFQFR